MSLKPWTYRSDTRTSLTRLLKSGPCGPRAPRAQIPSSAPGLPACCSATTLQVFAGRVSGGTRTVLQPEPLIVSVFSMDTLSRYVPALSLSVSPGLALATAAEMVPVPGSTHIVCFEFAWAGTAAKTSKADVAPTVKTAAFNIALPFCGKRSGHTSASLAYTYRRPVMIPCRTGCACAMTGNAGSEPPFVIRPTRTRPPPGPKQRINHSMEGCTVVPCHH